VRMGVTIGHGPRCRATVVTHNTQAEVPIVFGRGAAAALPRHAVPAEPSGRLRLEGEVVNACYEHGAIIMTGHKSVAKCGSVLGDA
jgi:hypothetical protein